MPEANLKITVDAASAKVALDGAKKGWDEQTKAIKESEKAAKSFAAVQRQTLAAEKAARRTMATQYRADVAAAYTINKEINRSSRLASTAPIQSPGFIAGAMNMRTLVAGAGIYGMASFAMSAMDAAGKADKATRSFYYLLQSSGRGAESAGALKALAEATNYTADKSELAAGANRMLAVNSKLTIAQMVTATAYAKHWADATGGEVVPAMEEVAMVLNSAAPRVAKHIGLEFDEAKAYEATAAALHKKVTALTELEKLDARRASLLALMGQRVATAPVGGAGDTVKQVKTAWKEVQEGLGKGIAEEFDPILAPFADFLSGRKTASEAAMKWAWKMDELLRGSYTGRPEAEYDRAVGSKGSGAGPALLKEEARQRALGSGNTDRLIIHPRAFHINEVGG